MSNHKKYSFEAYQKNEKRLLWRDFAMNILIGASIAGCFVMAGYAIFWFIMKAFTTPILFVYAFICILIIIGIRQAWLHAKEREESRKTAISLAMDYQCEANDWEARITKFTEVPLNETEEERKIRRKELEFAKHQFDYYMKRRDECMHDYVKNGGKKFI